MRIAYLALIELDVENACSVHTREIGEQLAALGHEVTLILPRPLRARRWAGVRHLWVRWWGFDRWRQLAFYLQSAWMLVRCHRARPFDALYVREAIRHPFLPGLARWLGLPLFVEVNGWALDDFRLIGASARELAEIERSQGALLRAAKGILVSTVGNAEKVASQYHIPTSRIMVQELGTNTEHFKPGERLAVRRSLGLPPEGPIVLFAGSFHPHHDVRTLVEAFAGLATHDRRATLLLIGQGAQWEPIGERIAAMGLADRVCRVPGAPYEQIASYYQAADVGVLPLSRANIRQRNGCIALKLWDYMAAGLPVVATDLPDTASYPLLHDKAVLVPPEDPHAMEKALRDLAERGELRERLGRAGRDYVVQFRGWRRAAEDTVRFMNERLRESA